VPRRRNYTKEYAERTKRGLASGLSLSQVRGHPKADEPSTSELQALPVWTVTFPAQDPPRLVTVQSDLATAKRVGRYDRKLRDLREGRITPGDFRRYAQRVRPVGGMYVVTDPATAVALVEVATTEDWIFESGRNRPRRTRRTR
jgi:hypothetical protein